VFLDAHDFANVEGLAQFDFYALDVVEGGQPKLSRLEMHDEDGTLADFQFSGTYHLPSTHYPNSVCRQSLLVWRDSITCGKIAHSWQEAHVYSKFIRQC